MKKVVAILGLLLVGALLLGGCDWLQFRVKDGFLSDGSYDPARDERPRAALTISLPGSGTSSVFRAQNWTWSADFTDSYGVWVVDDLGAANIQYFLAESTVTSVQFMVPVGSYEVYVIAAAEEGADPDTSIFYITGAGNASTTVAEAQSNQANVILQAYDPGGWVLTPLIAVTDLGGPPGPEFEIPSGETVSVVFTPGVEVSDRVRMDMDFAYSDTGGPVGSPWAFTVWNPPDVPSLSHDITTSATIGDHQVAVTGSSNLNFFDVSTSDWFAPVSGGRFALLTTTTSFDAHTSNVRFSRNFTVTGLSLAITVEWGAP
ncbi:MAG: hypothetical protein E4H09_00130 [Spirochaetales bacterium]|nr:MAG: hypothetical protein E4H09_00130 [Spirochaetales bacterium]